MTSMYVTRTYFKKLAQAWTSLYMDGTAIFAPELIGPICLPKPKTSGFQSKKASVRSLCVGRSATKKMTAVSSIYKEVHGLGGYLCSGKRNEQTDSTGQVTQPNVPAYTGALGALLGYRIFSKLLPLRNQDFSMDYGCISTIQSIQRPQVQFPG